MNNKFLGVTNIYIYICAGYFIGFTCLCQSPSHQGLIVKNNLGIGNVNMPTTRHVLGYYTLYRLLTFKRKLYINLLFCF